MKDANEREWEVQELARQAERLGLDPTQDDGRVGRYRLLTRVLRQPLSVALPEDFAQQVAARAAVSPVISAPASKRIEAVFLAVLTGVLIVCAGFILALHAQYWVAAIRAVSWEADSASVRWPLALVGCTGLSWMLEMWQHRWRA